MDKEERTENPDPYYYHDPDVGEEGPAFSVGEFFRSVGKRGLKATLRDPAIEPHAHLITLLSIVLVMAIGAGVVLAL